MDAIEKIVLLADIYNAITINLVGYWNDEQQNNYILRQSGTNTAVDVRDVRKLIEESDVVELYLTYMIGQTIHRTQIKLK